MHVKKGTSSNQTMKEVKTEEAKWWREEFTSNTVDRVYLFAWRKRGNGYQWEQGGSREGGRVYLLLGLLLILGSLLGLVTI